jgi:transcriptional regulator with XRE-family HTH domain
MTQEPAAQRRRAGNEGALYTKRIVDAITGRRTELGWSAERLAEEMTAVGVPWTRDAVSNLETGRRKNIAVHELLALAWVLDIPNPVDLLVPHGQRLEATTFPVTPGILVNPDAVRAWFRGETGPLRARLEEAARDAEADYEESIREAVSLAWEQEGPVGGKTPEEVADAILAGLRERRGGSLVLPPGALLYPHKQEGEDTDGEG